MLGVWKNCSTLYDETEAFALSFEAKQSGDCRLIAGTGVAIVLANPALSTLEKLTQYEVLHAELERLGAEGEVCSPIRLAIAASLMDLDDFEGAAQWFRKVVDEEPLDAQSAKSLVDALWKAKDWGEAAIELERQITRYGKAPGYLFAYGRSLYEAGDFWGAIPALNKSMSMSRPGEDIHSAANELRERAFELVDNIPQKPMTFIPAPIVTLDAVHTTLNDFAVFISNVKRMEFWQKGTDGKKSKWRPSPEQFGQTLLHTFLRARFSHNTQIFEEINAGAGRIDILAQFMGGLRVIIELKMCGAGYSGPYAQSGEEQICHYMDNEKVHTGVLLTFDARVRGNGDKLLRKVDSNRTITEVSIDVRHTVKG